MSYLHIMKAVYKKYRSLYALMSCGLPVFSGNECVGIFCTAYQPHESNCRLIRHIYFKFQEKLS